MGRQLLQMQRIYKLAGECQKALEAIDIRCGWIKSASKLNVSTDTTASCGAFSICLAAKILNYTNMACDLTTGLACRDQALLQGCRTTGNALCVRKQDACEA